MLDTLTLEIESEGHTETVSLDISTMTEAEAVKVVALAGYEAFYDLSEGNWNEEAANAVLYVKIYNPGDEWHNEDAPPYDSFNVDWSEVGLAAPDPVIEAELGDLSEGI